MSDAEADLWRYALEVYGAEGVAAECLGLQEAQGVDVPLLLCALWLARRGVRLEPAGLARLAEAVGPWHAEVVRPLRAVRQRMKQGPAPAPSPRTETLRDAVKAAELNAEKIELATLAETAADLPRGAPQDPAHNLRIALAHFTAAPVPADATRRLLQAARAAGDTA
jgi:uncharacterized protein (TIGR02444 family)